MSFKEVVRAVLPRGNKPHRIQSGPLKGKRIVTSWHDYPAAIRGYAEVELTNWLLETARPGETWLDVGAHYGYTSLALCQAVGQSGRVYSFEPNLRTAACLDRTREIEALWQWRILPFGLSDDEQFQVVQLPVVRGMVDSQLGEGESDGTAQLLTVGFDAVWGGISDSNGTVHGVKIDVQGMEVACLRGMRAMLAEQRPKIVLEIHDGVSRADVIDLLQEAGYDTNPQPIERPALDFFEPSTNQSFVFVPSR